MQTEKPTPCTRLFMSGPILNATLAELLSSALYLYEARCRARIAPLRRSPISAFTKFSTLPMASEEPFSGILPGWVARRALRIRAKPLGASPTLLGPMEPVATPSRRVVQQLAAPVQLDERVASCSTPARRRACRYGRHRCRVVPRHLCMRWSRLTCLWARPVPVAAPCR